MNKFGTTWGWVINDRIVIFELTIPLICVVKSLTNYLYEPVHCSEWKHNTTSAVRFQNEWLLLILVNQNYTVRTVPSDSLING